MPRLMSFALTTPQFIDGSKTVTRRNGWKNLQPGDIVSACKKAMGMKKGEKVERLGDIEIVSIRRERLDAITLDDVAREGFPQWAPEQFIAMYCAANNCLRDREVTRIEFRRVDAQSVPAAKAIQPPSDQATETTSVDTGLIGRVEFRDDAGLSTLDRNGVAVVLLPSIRMPRLVTRREVDRSYRRNEKQCMAHGLNCIA